VGAFHALNIELGDWAVFGSALPDSVVGRIGRRRGRWLRGMLVVVGCDRIQRVVQGRA
jgi:hypothetical protein